MSPSSKSKRLPLTKQVQLAVFKRDGWMCRWCNRPTIFAPTMRLLEREAEQSGLTNQLAYHHDRWTRDGSPLLDELGAVIDHVNAASAGGTNTEENLVTACNKCNGRKSAAPLQKWNVRPRRKPVKGKYGEPQHWDGLSTLFIVLAERNSAFLTATEKAWLNVFRGDRLVERLRGIVAFLPAFEAADFKFGNWTKQTSESGVTVLPHFYPSEVAELFEQKAYEFGWVLRGFDWSTWKQTPEAESLRDDEQTIANATPEQLARLLTVCIRQERFCEGELEAAFQSGLLTRILRRAAAILTEIEGRGRQRLIA